MTDIARITKHPTDRECVLVHVAEDLNARMGRFGPARLSPDFRAYVVHASHVDAFYRFARREDIHVSDERRVGKPSPVKIPPSECRHCSQPGSRLNPPMRCPACGQPWQAIPPPVREDPITKTPCASCGHKQPGRFPYCARCGTPMRYEGPAVKPAPVLRPDPERERRAHLDDPLPLGAVIATSAAVTGNPTTALARLDGRPVQDVDLPEPEQAKAEPNPAQVEHLHCRNAAVAAVRHEPVPSRDVAVEEATENPWPDKEPRQLPPQVVKDALTGRRPLPPRDGEDPAPFACKVCGLVDPPEDHDCLPPDPSDPDDPWASRPAAIPDENASWDPWGPQPS